MRIYRFQGIAVLIFVPISVSITLMQSVHDTLMLIGAGVALVHIASYAPRTALRAAGDARFESLTKVIERIATTAGYGILFLINSTDVVAYANVFLVGAILGLSIALVGAYRVCAKSGERTDSSELGLSLIHI